MKIVFLDIDGVLNSYQSSTFWHNKRDQQKWENELYDDWKGSLKEYLALEFDPIAISNLEELMRRVPEAKIVISSTWRYGETVESLKKIFHCFPLISNAIIDKTPTGGKIRGDEINAWILSNQVDKYVILDDDSDMRPEQMVNFVNTDSRNGFVYTDMEKAQEILK